MVQPSRVSVAFPLSCLDRPCTPLAVADTFLRLLVQNPTWSRSYWGPQWGPQTTVGVHNFDQAWICSRWSDGLNVFSSLGPVGKVVFQPGELWWTLEQNKSNFMGCHMDGFMAGFAVTSGLKLFLLMFQLFFEKWVQLTGLLQVHCYPLDPHQVNIRNNSHIISSSII